MTPEPTQEVPNTVVDLFDMSGKVAVITGGGRGLGYEMAYEFAKRGATVVLASRKLEVCEAAAATIAAETGARTLALQCHVGDWDACTALVEQVLAELGTIDVLINNAGMSPLYESLSTISEALYDKVLDVNLKGPFRLCSLVAEHMQDNGGGSIINISSIASVEPTSSEVPYALAKSALNTLTIALAHMFGPNVRANGILPGAFLTDISLAWDMDAFNKRAKKEIAAQRGGEPHEIVGAALYLASGASSYTTGSLLKVDGGMTWGQGG